MLILDYDVNVIWAILVFFTLFMIIYNGVISFGENHLPTFIIELFRYGKTLDGPAKTQIIKLISVPKSYFTHFYIFSSIYVPCVLMTVLFYYNTNTKVSDDVTDTLDFLCSTDRHEATTSSRLVLVMILLTLQVFRRLYECIFINQPSTSSMNITHYIVGYAHYFCAATGYVCEAPGFVKTKVPVHLNTDLSLTSLTPDCWILTLIFFVAWYFEFEAHKIFARLKIKHPNTHSIPNGSLFNYVSCPHYLCEVIIYTCFMFLLGQAHLTGILVWFWVLTNQIIAATMSHNWYKKKFKEYPRNRSAIIPFIW